MWGVTSAGFTKSSRALSRIAAIVGIGETNYGDDYRASRQKEPGYVPPDDLSLATIAFERALADSGLRRADVDGLSACFIYGNPSAGRLAATLRLQPRYVAEEGYPQSFIDDAVPTAVVALADGQCDTIALVYAAAPRSTQRVFGGSTYTQGVRDATPTSYYYYTPWGWSSQAAHWAFIFQHYANEFGVTEAELGSVAVALRRHAVRNDNAIMRAPLTIDDYLASRYIVRPLHLLDMCLVNNGAVCVIIRRTELCADLPHVPVSVAGWGHATCAGENLHNMVRERLRPQFEASGRDAFEMAGLGRSDIGHFQGYDASSFHLVQQIEGFGFTTPGTGLGFCQDGEMDLEGAMPTNTNGGLLSEAYMHGWNNLVECVRQLRHEAGSRQVDSVGASLFSMATTESVHPLLLTREER